jgi:hypothetical protein
VQLELLANAISTGLGLLALLAFYYFVFQPMMADGFRERLERIRDSLAEAAGSGLIDPGPAYQRLVDIVDMLTEHASEVTFFRVLLASRLAERYADQFAAIPTFEKLLASTRSDSAKRRLLDARERIEMEIVRHVMLASIPGWIVLAGTYPTYVLVQARKLARKRRVSFARSFDRLVKKIGDEVPGPVRAMELQAALRVARCAA